MRDGPARVAGRRPKVRDRIRTIYIDVTMVGAMAAMVVVCGIPLWILSRTVDKGRQAGRRLAQMVFGGLLRHYAWVGGVPLVVDDSRAGEEWRAVGPCIVVANHASAMDVIVLMELPRGVGDGRVWAKRWPFEKPLLGRVMRMCGHMHVDDYNILPDSEACLRRGETLLVFPESSRSRTGELSRFRDGAFLLAARTGMPVVPVAIHGSRTCFPPGQPWIFRPVIRVEVLGVLRAEAAGDEGRVHAELKRRAHEMIAEALEEGRAEEAPDVEILAA